MHEQIYKGFEMLGKSMETTQNLQMTVEKNRREDREREERNRREDREREERNRREDIEREERNRREDIEREEMNRREDREREERYWERADKRFEKLLTNQTEILNVLRP